MHHLPHHAQRGPLGPLGSAVPTSSENWHPMPLQGKHAGLLWQPVPRRGLSTHHGLRGMPQA